MCGADFLYGPYVWPHKSFQPHPANPPRPDLVSRLALVFECGPGISGSPPRPDGRSGCSFEPGIGEDVGVGAEAKSLEEAAAAAGQAEPSYSFSPRVCQLFAVAPIDCRPYVYIAWHLRTCVPFFCALCPPCLSQTTTTVTYSRDGDYIEHHFHHD